MKPYNDVGQVVTVGQIAKMAGVGPSAVSNWRKRHADFPAPIQEAPGGDLFSRPEIEAWLELHSRVPEAGAPSGVPEEGEPGGRRGRTPTLPPKMKIGQRLTQGRLLSWMQLLYLHYCLQTDCDPTGGRVRSVWEELLRDPEKGREVWRAMVEDLDRPLGPDLAQALAPAGRVPSEDLEAAKWIDEFFPAGMSNHGLVADLLLAMHESATPVGPSSLTSTGVAKLVIELLAPLTGTLYDPAFGLGTFLAFGWNEREGADLRLCGQEINLFNWRVAFLRLKMRGADADLRTGDTILDDQFRSLRAERIAIDPPWGDRGTNPLPPDDRWPFDLAPALSEWVWIHHLLFHLSAKGRGIALLPSSLNDRGGPDRRERARILHSGDLDAVIDLPPGVLPGTSAAPTLLLFDRDREDRRERVLFIDGRRLGKSRRGMTRDLGEEERSRLVSEVREWRDGSFEPEARLSGAATISEIQEHDVVWAPSRYIGYVTRFTRLDGEHLGRRLDRLISETGPGVPEATLREMSEVLRVLKGLGRRKTREWDPVRLGGLFSAPPMTGSRQDPEADGEVFPFVKTELLREVGSAIRDCPGARTRGNVKSRLTEPGDLLLTSRGIDEDRAPRCVRVEVEEPLAYSESLMRLRLRQNLIDPDYLRLFLISQEGHMALAAITSGTTISNIRPDALANLEVPLPNLGIQRAIAATGGLAEDAVSQLEAFSQRMRDLSETLREGLISGVFRVE